MSESNGYTVYMHTCKINNKYYIGITQQQVEKRWGVEGCGYKTQLLFYRAIKKYGWNEGFNHEIIAINLSKQDACNLEIQLISHYKSNNPKFGYNIAYGGNINIPTELTKMKISKAHMGRKMSQEYCKSVSERVKGEKHPLYGKHHSEETKNKLRQAISGHKHSDETRAKMSKQRKGRIITNETRKKLSESNKGRTRKDLAIINMSRKGSNNPNAKPIICVETGVIYETIEAAATTLNLDHGSISKCCSGIRKTCAGFHWKFY
ncbi:NUMOD3 domain-containing DNA-binding protein [Ruminiclostridium cellobioparum]|uniref:Group I intron endonuclease n=1 Tax=Ruminiclostridium cellobioparum subsp. termitidis CT1112 TaxID=1195236 RepID=S0FSM4_RUMCE|nr:NUMOD3 domain-containing DNA-binding protein [Ruminiclostridium cellobioparum]EMS72179.1 group I intron endonuclease [Ruminiclostridium cellobioparum subsp. termitidis CT1112]